MSDLEFARASLWPWLLSLPLAWALAWTLFDRSRAAVAAYGAASRPAGLSALWRSLRLAVLLLLGLLCWMDPRSGEETIATERRGLDLLVCLDTSRSMLAGDMEPTRLQRALQDVRALLAKLSGGDRIGLVVFAGAARIAIPLTHDVDSFRGLLAEVDTDLVKVGGTDLAAALRRAQEIADPDNRATTVVLLLTDGEDLAGAGRQAAGELKDAGLVVHAVGYGSALGSKIPVVQQGQQEFLRDKAGQEVVSRMDPESLRKLAAATGGEFVRAEALPLPLNELYEKRLLPMQKRSYEAGAATQKQARYQWVLLPLLLLMLWDLAMAGGRR